MVIVHCDCFADNDCVFSKPVSQAVVKSKPLQDSNTVHASSGGRSPLASINYALSGRSKSDTPRGIVQRKQALRFEKMRNDANSPSIGSRQGQFPVYCDKENDF
jgi:hypothetical protein